MKNDKRTLPTTENAHQNTKQNDSIIVSCGIELIKEKGAFSVSSIMLSERMEVEHKAVINLVKKHADNFLKHGRQPVFKIQSSGQKKEAFLTEDQAYYLLALSRNTKKVSDLKSDLVSAFSTLRRKHELLIDRNAKLEYQQNRAIGKYHRRNLTDEIKPFIAYATQQGSTSLNNHYIHINKWINKACAIESIEHASEKELANVSSACDIAMNTIHAGITKAQNYKLIKKSIKNKLEIYGSLHRVGDA